MMLRVLIGKSFKALEKENPGSYDSQWSTFHIQFIKIKTQQQDFLCCTYFTDWSVFFVLVLNFDVEDKSFVYVGY